MIYDRYPRTKRAVGILTLTGVGFFAVGCGEQSTDVKASGSHTASQEVPSSSPQSPTPTEIESPTSTSSSEPSQKHVAKLDMLAKLCLDPRLNTAVQALYPDKPQACFASAGSPAGYQWYTKSEGSSNIAAQTLTIYLLDSSQLESAGGPPPGSVQKKVVGGYECVQGVIDLSSSGSGDPSDTYYGSQCYVGEGNDKSGVVVTARNVAGTDKNDIWQKINSVELATIAAAAD